MIKLLVSFGEKFGMPPGIFLAILCVAGAYATGGSDINKNVEGFHFLGLYNTAIWLGAYVFLWGVYHFSDYNWFSLNNTLHDTSDPKELNLKAKVIKQLKDTEDIGVSKKLDLAAMTKYQLIGHAKTLGLSLNMRLKKQEIINQINNH